MDVERRHFAKTFGLPACMLALIQRVTQAKVEVGGTTVGAIGPGLLALVGIEPADGPAQVARMAERVFGYRVFADDEDGWVGGRLRTSINLNAITLWPISIFNRAIGIRYFRITQTRIRSSASRDGNGNTKAQSKCVSVSH